MRILQIAQKPQRRGAETFAFQLSEQLREMGHEVATTYLYPHTGDETLPLGGDDTLLDGREAHPLERALGFHPGLMTRLRQRIAAYEPQVVQANGARTLKYTGLAAQFGRRDWKLLYRNIGDPAQWIRGRRQRLFYSFVMQGLDGVVGVSATTLDRVRDFYDLPIPMRHVPRAVRPEALEPARARDAIRAELNTPDDVPVVVWVGSLSPEKRVDRLVTVLDGLPEDLASTHLWLVGDGPEREALAAHASRIGAGPRIRFAGMQADVASFLGAADLLALTSDTEGIPGVVLEAGWLKRPAVATDVGGVAECVRHGETGLVVPAGDEPALVAALARLLYDGAEREAMGARAHEFVAGRFLMADVAAAYVAFYQELLAA